jgi:hypothetical protein
MSYLFFPRAVPGSWASWVPSSVIDAGRFVLHYGEIVVAMYAGMLIYMPL